MKKHLYLYYFLILILACQQQSKNENPKIDIDNNIESQSQKPDILSISKSSSASLVGTITYEGEIPSLPEIKMNADPMCAQAHNQPVKVENLVLGDDQSLANVVVRVKSDNFKNFNFPSVSEPASLTQKGCTYYPHVMGVRVGQVLQIFNEDSTSHNVHGMTKKNQEYNVSMPKFLKKIERQFDKPEDPFLMKCDIHPWMTSYVFVSDNPFFAVTDREGKFNITGLPVGQYTVEFWHEKLGIQSKTIDLREGEKKSLNIIFTKL